MQVSGWLLVAAGLACFLFGLGFDPSLASEGFDRIINMGLLAQKQALQQAGGFMFLGGLILLGANEICTAIRNPLSGAARSAGPGTLTVNPFDGQF